MAMSEENQYENLFLAAQDDLFMNDEGFLQELDLLTVEIETEPSMFHCLHCEKICKSQRGLTRHTNVKHPEGFKTTETITDIVEVEESMLVDLSCFENLVGNCVKKIGSDEVGILPDDVVGEIKSWSFSDLSSVFIQLKPVITEFVQKGNSEKFFPKFANIVDKNGCIFPNLGRDSCIFLGFELANHISAFVRHGHFYREKVDEASIQKLKLVNDAD